MLLSILAEFFPPVCLVAWRCRNVTHRSCSMVVGLILKFKFLKHLSPFQYLVTGVQNRAYKSTHKRVCIPKSRDVSNTGEETALQFHVMCAFECVLIML